ncbi:unnamed protein product [Acanthoscelides obtectus]|uniref:Uncharacterized protein n=1 Tax=Acanthoscelides obtectus TaxID=200917 RepID=A0A9P0KY19_ACAOB|nr:unnamed protein product [Acanthoscelides obtectus]CAH1985250.1 unnamed protein product [Acanthoscelides obtectus]CAK1676103.1 hypothetical protein AOBTE_LOCUS30586 [Acanthoscelides obtectus]CAK1676105.1 hypothetical protein AOBTE_LOCUS30588 [Acanthoscelides obtectus]
MEFCANPPYQKAIWIAKDTRVYKPGDADNTVIAYGITNTSDPNCHQAVLFLPRVSSSDLGEYSLIVRSAAGVAEGSFHLNMTYASGLNEQRDQEARGPRAPFVDGVQATSGQANSPVPLPLHNANVIILPSVVLASSLFQYCYYY